MLKRLHKNDFIESMLSVDSCKFTKFGLHLLFDYLNDSMPEDYIIDFVGMNCRYSQLSYDDINDYYSICLNDDGSILFENSKDRIISFLRNKTIVVAHNDIFVIFEEF